MGCVKQAYNGRIGAWVKGKVTKNPETGGNYFKVLDVKQREPKKPFKGVKKY